ncbi:hypothetical protein ACIPL1_09615 [Pseudomonas sp. NPDC090202]|uniref:hypothetical protein n=1 Tax=unclassified Pseudomonas TaxID=196821 RepID=UPI0037F30176
MKVIKEGIDMSRVKYGLSLFLCLSLAACVNTDHGVTQVDTARTSVGTRAQEDLGQYVARQLTARYADVAVGCDNNSKPAYLCNGVLFRAVNDSLKPPIWDVADKDIARGAVTFAYMRANVKFKSLINGYSHGYIFKPYLQASGKLNPQVRCVFPLGASTDERDEQGCGASSGYPKSGLCRVNGVTSADQWLVHFRDQAGGAAKGQCGFSLTLENSSTVFHDFAVTVAVRVLMGEEAFSQSNELLLSVWPNGKGKELPLEAFFYVADSTTGRESARRDQQDLNTRDGVLIPVIRVTLPQTASSLATFRYSAADQTTPMPPALSAGAMVAANLTARYADTAANCGSDSKPAFLCSGVMIRATGSKPTYHVWENSPASLAKGGVSFSYVRADAPVFRLAYTYTNGYIMKAYEHSESTFKPEVLCFFPTDGDSVNRSGKGCGPHKGSPSSDLCHLNGVTTAQQWWEHYTAHSSGRDGWQCSFDVSGARESLAGPAFHEGIKAMSLIDREPLDKPNEMILAAWQNGVGKTLPLEAFFYMDGSAPGLTDAKRNQQDLFDTHGVVIPVIKLKLPPAENDVATFTYDDADQAVPMPEASNPGASITTDLAARFAMTGKR